MVQIKQIGGTGVETQPPKSFSGGKENTDTLHEIGGVWPSFVHRQYENPRGISDDDILTP